MQDLRLFDANCTVGRHLKLQAGGPHTSQDLLAEMDHFGIAEALVLDSLSRENHPADGNARILNVVADTARLHAAWAALPIGALDEQPEPRQLVAMMRQHKVGAVFLFPKQYRFELSDWCIDALLEPLAEAHVPVFVNYNEVGRGGWQWDETDWRAVVDLCRRWPRLPVVVTECRIRRANRLIYRALDACENLHIELSGYWLHRGIEYISRNWGSRRLIFGSNWPSFGHGQTLGMLTCAEIDDSDKRAIAGGNLRSLLSWCSPEHPQVQHSQPTDEFVQFGRTGIPVPSFEIWDCHGHFGPFACHYHLPDSSLEATVHELDRLGVKKVLLFSFAGVFSDETFGNDRVAEAVRRYPDRFVGLALLNPHRGRDEMLRELERCQRLGLRGIKLIPYYQGHPEDGTLIEMACRWAHDRQQIILNHNWGPTEFAERLAATYTRACLIDGHTHAEHFEIAQRYKNFFVCSCPLLAPRHCERIV